MKNEKDLNELHVFILFLQANSLCGLFQLFFFFFIFTWNLDRGHLEALLYYSLSWSVL